MFLLCVWFWKLCCFPPHRITESRTAVEWNSVILPPVAMWPKLQFQKMNKPQSCSRVGRLCCPQGCYLSKRECDDILPEKYTTRIIRRGVAWHPSPLSALPAAAFVGLGFIFLGNVRLWEHGGNVKIGLTSVSWTFSSREALLILCRDYTHFEKNVADRFRGSKQFEWFIFSSLFIG